MSTPHQRVYGGRGMAIRQLAKWWAYPKQSLNIY